MTRSDPHAPRADVDPRDAARLRLSGDWTLEHADAIAAALRESDDGVRHVDARDVRRLDSLGVLQLLRYATRRGLADDALEFHGDHAALVQAIDDVRDERPKSKREYGVRAALERLGRAMHDNGREIVALVSFLGETLVKLLRLLRDPGRLRLTATVHHMEQVGLDAVPLVALLSFLIGAVIAFLGSNILADFGASIYVVELVSIAFLREFAVLLTSVILAGRTASAFTAQIGSMVNREEVDAIRTLGLDPIDLLVIPRAQARGLDIVHHDHALCDRAAEPEHPGGVQHRHDDDEVQHRWAKDGQQDQREDQLRDRHQDVDRPAQHLVDPAAGNRRHQPQCAPQDEREHGGEEGDADGVARTVDQAGKHVPAQLVGAEEELPAPRIEGAADQLGLGIGCEQRREDRGENVDGNDDEAEPGAGRRLAQVAP